MNGIKIGGIVSCDVVKGRVHIPRIFQNNESPDLLQETSVTFVGP
jgi:hypothetical protein